MNNNHQHNKVEAVVPVDSEMLSAVIQHGEAATIELDASIVHMDLGTVEFLRVLRKNYVLDRLRLVLKSNDPQEVQEYYKEQQVLDGQIALLTYLLEVNIYNLKSNDTTEE